MQTSADAHTKTNTLTHACTEALVSHTQIETYTHNQTNANLHTHTHTHNPTPPHSTSIRINNQQSEALWSLWSCDLWPVELTLEQAVLRGEPGSSLKGGEVPMRTGTGAVQWSKTLTMMAMKGLKWTSVFWHAGELGWGVRCSTWKNLRKCC